MIYTEISFIFILFTLFKYMGNSGSSPVTSSNVPRATNLSANVSNQQYEKRTDHIHLTNAADHSLVNFNSVFDSPSRTPVLNGEGQIYYVKKFNATYQGNLANGNPNGKGVAHFADGGYYSGDFVNGDANGFGTYIFPNGSVYQGQFANSKFSGKGQLVYVDTRMKYQGQFANGLPHGHGREQYYDHGYYEGDFKAGLKDGQGRYVWPGGNQYRGSFANGIMHGRGQLFNNKGEVMYTGQFVHGKKSGNGVFRTQDGSYEGYFDNDLLNGKGTFVYNDGKVYEGQFLNSKMHGNGTMYYTSNQLARGTWENNHNKYLEMVKNQSSVKNKIQQILQKHRAGLGTSSLARNQGYESSVGVSDSYRESQYRNPSVSINPNSQVDPFRNQRVSEYA